MTTSGLLRCLIGGRGPLNIISSLSVFQTNCRSQQAVLGLFSNNEQTREMSRVKRRKTHPFFWHRKKILRTSDDQLSSQNTLFVKEYLHEKYSEETSPLKGGELVKTEWSPNTRRTGVIARNIGLYPMWKKDGTRIICTLLEVLDNHVIRYIPPEDYVKTRIGETLYKNRKPKGCLVVGAEATAPSKFTKQYCNLFREAGVMPKKRLMKFTVTPNAALPVGTPITAGHFVVGQAVDIIGKTIDRGFQGVMKRWGFAGGPASHGATKFHRKGGTIGHGRNKSRVYPGTKMPGHMGSERRALLGVTIMRINLKHNVIYVQGPIQGGTNSIVKICDTILPHRKLKEAPPHPTYFPPEDGKLSEEDIHDPSLHRFGTPTIMATS